MPDHTDDTVLQLVKVSKSFGPVNVIKDVTLSVRRGQVQALLGENGAGKSTLIKMIRSEEHTSELQSRFDLVCRLLLEKKNNNLTAIDKWKTYLTNHPHVYY